jgi:flavodoxin
MGFTMKNLVVYFSLTGNTEVVAKEISSISGGDLKKLEPVHPMNPSSFAGAVFSAMLGLKRKLKPLDCSVKDYDNIFIGGQIWAGHSTPPINAFLDKTDFSGKTVYLFLTQADDKEPTAVNDSIRSRIEKHGGKVANTFFIQTKMKTVISPEAVKQPISDWLRKTNILSA